MWSPGPFSRPANQLPRPCTPDGKLAKNQPAASTSQACRKNTQLCRKLTAVNFQVPSNLFCGEGPQLAWGEESAKCSGRVCAAAGRERSEERRVGKECRSRWS